jgi:hypothetical protein
MSNEMPGTARGNADDMPAAQPSKPLQSSARLRYGYVEGINELNYRQSELSLTRTNVRQRGATQ